MPTNSFPPPHRWVQSSRSSSPEQPGRPPTPTPGPLSRVDQETFGSGDLTVEGASLAPWACALGWVGSFCLRARLAQLRHPRSPDDADPA